MEERMGGGDEEIGQRWTERLYTATRLPSCQYPMHSLLLPGEREHGDHGCAMYGTSTRARDALDLTWPGDWPPALCPGEPHGGEKGLRNALTCIPANVLSSSVPSQKRHQSRRPEGANCGTPSIKARGKLIVVSPRTITQSSRPLVGTFAMGSCHA